ncbi:SGNH/GDSL hydrolase family protein [Streptococcus agalactiae]|uniref:SGNH/GDSL hydrolase family protein n=1 Tax=Streptococcus agalactiae TaxID=1311 RepID=UPI0008109896|nr:SGNH/GDSL hydrolase family protein [Streptococcus agalactiae]OCM12735.1 lipase [Streptococcus agalactiae]
MLEVIDKALRDYQMKREQFFEINNQTVQEGAIVFTGDSIVEFFPLTKHLGRDYPLVNRGVAGSDSYWLLENLRTQVWELLPSKVFILIGTNDIGLGHSQSEIIANITDIIAEIRAESYMTEINILSVLPVSEEDDYIERVKVRNNQAIKALNKTLSVISGINYIELYDLLVDEKGQLASSFTKDGLHLTDQAYAKISETIKLHL